MNPDWWEDKEFVAELEERAKRWETGIDKGYTLDDVKAYLDEQRKSRQEKLSTRDL